MVGDRRSLGALGVSALLHLAVAAGIASGGSAAARERPVTPDSISGNTFDVDAVVMEPPRPATPAPEPPAPPPRPAAAQVEPPVAMPAPPPRPARPAPRTPASPPEERAPRGEAGEPADVPPPRPRAARPAAAEVASAGAPAASEAAAAPAPATYGAAGAAASERNLAKAFTRAIPAAVSKDAIWSELPLGPAGKARIEFTVDDEGKIASAEPEEQPEQQLGRLLARTLVLLKSGRFALSSGEKAGTETLELEATISERAASDDEFANPRDPVHLGFEPPSAERPGRAFFTLASGRHVEIRVRLRPPRG
jgi:outer membrane biosynthesis protein TonB